MLPLLKLIKGGGFNIFAMAETIGGTNVPNRIVPYTTDDTYATHDEQYGRGGYRSVATVDEMNAISTKRRKDGMLVKVIATNTFYTLKNNKFVEENFTGTGSATLKYIQVDRTQLDAIISDEPDDSAKIIALFGQTNLDRMFTEDGCPIEVLNAGGSGISIYTKCVMKSVADSVYTIGIPLEAYNYCYLLMKNGSNYELSSGRYMTFDFTISSGSTNAPQTRIVYDALSLKAGVYVTGLQFGAIEVRTNKSVTSGEVTEVANILAAWKAKKVVISNDESGNEKYHGIVNNIFVTGGKTTITIQNSEGYLKAFSYDSAATTKTWTIETLSSGSSPVEEQIYAFTSVGLFNVNRGSTVYNLNVADLALFKSLFNGGWRTKKLYYLYDDGEYTSLVPMSIYGALDISFEDAYGMGQPIQIGIVNALGQVLSDELMIINENTVSTNLNGAYVYSSSAVAVSSSFGSNGYTKFNNGLLIQWGSTTGGNNKSVYFPVAFANTNYIVTTTSQDTSSNLVIKNAISSKYTTYFKLYSNYINTNPSAGTAGSNLYWLAVGTWR